MQTSLLQPSNFIGQQVIKTEKPVESQLQALNGLVEISAKEAQRITDHSTQKCANAEALFQGIRMQNGQQAYLISSGEALQSKCAGFDQVLPQQQNGLTLGALADQSIANRASD
jgi:hypothetical protein